MRRDEERLCKREKERKDAWREENHRDRPDQLKTSGDQAMVFEHRRHPPGKNLKQNVLLNS